MHGSISKQGSAHPRLFLLSLITSVNLTASARSTLNPRKASSSSSLSSVTVAVFSTVSHKFFQYLRSNLGGLVDRRHPSGIFSRDAALKSSIAVSQSLRKSETWRAGILTRASLTNCGEREKQSVYDDGDGYGNADDGSGRGGWLTSGAIIFSTKGRRLLILIRDISACKAASNGCQIRSSALLSMCVSIWSIMECPVKGSRNFFSCAPTARSAAGAEEASSAISGPDSSANMSVSNCVWLSTTNPRAVS